MAERLDNLIKSVGAVLGERKRLERVEKKVVKALNAALSKIGYKVVSAKETAPKRRRRRRARRVARTRRGRARRRTNARPVRRRTGAGRRRARAKK